MKKHDLNENTAGFTNQSGQYIFFRNWKTVTPLKGVVIIVHGLNSHSGYYHQFATTLNENGFEVYAADLAGRGYSEGERYYLADYQTTIADIDRMLEIAKDNHPTAPIFLMGHSAGGVFASVYALVHQTKLNGLILESTAFQLPVPRFALAIVKLLGNLIPHIRLIKLKNEDFSRNPSHVDLMNSDPLLENEKQPAKTMQQLILAAEYLKMENHGITIPLLALHGTADHATLYQGSEYLVQHASSPDKTLKLYEGHYHDLLSDTSNGIVIKDIVQWLTKRA